MGDLTQFVHTLARILLAIILGGLMGIERELHGHGAGFRTHIMVSLGAAMFVMAGISVANISPTDLTRVIQGVATGIGFLGAGTIIKLTDRLEVKGLTTASSIWLASAVGVATGLGQYGLAVAGTVVSIVVLALLRPLDQFFHTTGKDGK